MHAPPLRRHWLPAPGRVLWRPPDRCGYLQGTKMSYWIEREMSYWIERETRRRNQEVHHVEPDEGEAQRGGEEARRRHGCYPMRMYPRVGKGGPRTSVLRRAPFGCMAHLHGKATRSVNLPHRAAMEGPPKTKTPCTTPHGGRHRRRGKVGVAASIGVERRRAHAHEQRQQRLRQREATPCPVG